MVRPSSNVAVKKIRKRLGLSRSRCAKRFGFTTRTVQEWEQRRRTPEGPARILLKMIEKEPDAVERVLSEI